MATTNNNRGTPQGSEPRDRPAWNRHDTLEKGLRLKTPPTQRDLSVERTSRPSKALRLLAMLLVASVSGCGGDDAQTSQGSPAPAGVTLPAKLTFVATNQTDKALKNVMIEGFAYNIKFTAIRSGDTRRLLGMKPMNMASKMTVSWADAKGGSRRSTSVRTTLPKSFNGTLRFTIHPKGKVSCQPGTVSGG